MVGDERVTPERIMQHLWGAAATGMLGAGVENQVFAVLAGGPRTAADLATAAGISRRGAQALLDGLVALGLVTCESGVYANGPDAAEYLVPGQPGYLGDLAVLEGLDCMWQWARLHESVRTGARLPTETPSEDFFRRLVPAIAPLAHGPATQVIETLGLAQAGAIDVLDVGGGSGAWAVALGRANPALTVTQLDLAPVNRVARELVSRAGLGSRFRTVDGDLLADDFGWSRYDLAVYAHVAHMLGPHDNLAVFEKLRRALKPTGTLVVADFVLDDDRRGPPFALMFHANMLVKTEAGACWRQADYRLWLGDAGFGEIRIAPTPGPVTLVFATPR